MDDMETFVKGVAHEIPATPFTNKNLLIQHGEHGYRQTDPVAGTILFFKQKFKLVLIAGLISYVLSYLLLALFYVTSTSKITFLIDDSDPESISTSDQERMVLSQLTSLSKNRMYFFLYSDEMAMRLDRGIDMGAHYGLDKGDPGFKSNLIEKMVQHITYSRDRMNQVTIEVRDRDKYFASLLANTIFRNLVEINNETVFGNLRYKLRVYSMNKQAIELKRQQDMERLIHTVNQLKETNAGNGVKSDAMYMMKQDIMKMFTEYNNTLHEQDKKERVFDTNTSILQDTTLQTLFLVNQAYPKDISRSYIRAGFYSSGIALVVMIYSFVMMLLFRKYKNYFHLLFGIQKGAVHEQGKSMN